jgi:hypothetical protein
VIFFNCAAAAGGGVDAVLLVWLKPQKLLDSMT